VRALEVVIFPRMAGVDAILTGKYARTILSAIRTAVN
jgi:hypothetical protein